MVSLRDRVDSVTNARACGLQDSKQRLKAMQKSTLPITASAFNRDGSIFAYSVRISYHALTSFMRAVCIHTERCVGCS